MCIISGYPPSIGRGSESTSMLVESLSKQKVEVIVLGNIAHDMCRKEKVDNVTIVRTWSPSSLKSVFGLIKQLVSANPDVVHIIYGYLYYGRPIFSAIFITSMLIVLRILRKPAVLTIHQVFSTHEITKDFLSIFTSNLPSIAIKMGFLLLNKAIGLLSSRVIVVHKEHANILQKNYKLNNVVCIPIGLSSSRVVSKNNAKRALDLTNRKLLLVFGFIVPYKGVEYAIRAMHKVIKRIPEALLIIAGTTVPSASSCKEAMTYIGNLRSLIRDLELSDHIILRNEYIPETDVPLYFGSSEVVILPNTEQTGPSEVWRLAAIYGVPSVATEISYFKEDIVDGETGLLVPVEDSESIAKAAVELLTNDFLRAKICRNLKELSQNYEASNIARKHVRLYESLLSKKCTSQKQ